MKHPPDLRGQLGIGIGEPAAQSAFLSEWPVGMERYDGVAEYRKQQATRPLRGQLPLEERTP